jgi:hypothetical protein
MTYKFPYKESPYRSSRREWTLPAKVELGNIGNQTDPIGSHKKMTSYICNSLFLAYGTAFGKDLWADSI